MPKPSRGGQRGSGMTRQTVAAASANQSATLTVSPTKIASGDILPSGGVSFSSFEKMTDDKKATVVKDAINSGTPMFLDNSCLQRFAYYTGMSDKPKIMTEAQLAQENSRDLWRSVKDSYKKSADIGYTGKDIYNQLAKGDYTNYSDGGGSAYGKGIYFDVRKGSYGSGRGWTVIHAKLSDNAKIITYSKLSNMYSNALSRGDKLAKACSQADHNSRENLYALAKGYDVVEITGVNYYVVLNRRALLVSDKTF